MVYCCVPFCKSQSKSKKKKNSDAVGVSFHEFPLNDDLMQKWVKNIRRDKWTPDMTNDRVCGLHFTDDDYVIGLKIKRLKAGSIPTQFPSYPQHMRKAPIQSSPRKAPTERKPVPPPKKKRKSLCPEENDTESSTKLGTPEQMTSPSSTALLAKNPNLYPELVNYPTAIKIPITNEVVQRLVIEEDPYADIFKLNNKLRSEKVKISRLRKRLDRSEEQVNELKAKLKDNEEYLEIIRNVKNAAAEGNLGAEFLLSQLKRFGKTKIHYNEKIVRHCIRWRASSPVGYEYPRKCKLMNLPGRRTLAKHIQKFQVDAGTLTQKRPDQTTKDVNVEALRCASIIIDEMARNYEDVGTQTFNTSQTFVTIQQSQVLDDEQALHVVQEQSSQEETLHIIQDPANQDQTLHIVQDPTGRERTLHVVQNQMLETRQEHALRIVQDQARGPLQDHELHIVHDHSLGQEQTLHIVHGQALSQEQLLSIVQDQALAQEQTLLQEQSVHEQEVQEQAYIQEQAFTQEQALGLLQEHSYIQEHTYVLEQTLQTFQ